MRSKQALLAAVVVALAACGATPDVDAPRTDTVTTTDPATTLPSTQPVAPPPLTTTVAPPSTTSTTVPELPSATAPPPTPDLPTIDLSAAGPSMTGTTSAQRQPSMTVTYPEPGTRVDTRRLEFTGNASPGATVTAARRYAVLANADGDWAIDLVLNPGGNVATFTVTDTQGGTAEVRVPVFYDPPLELRPDGIGTHDFGTTMETVVPALIDLLGEPDRDDTVDRGDLPPEMSDGEDIFVLVAYPAIAYFRALEWEGVGLELLFSDYATSSDWPPTPGPIVFNGWIVRDPGDYGSYLDTSDGVRIGTTLQALEGIYGTALVWDEMADDLTGDWHFAVDSGKQWPGTESTYRYHGRFDGDPLRPNTTVAWISAGFSYDEC